MSKKNFLNGMGIEVKEIYFPWMEFRLDSRGWNVLAMIGKVFDGRALKCTGVDDVNNTKNKCVPLLLYSIKNVRNL